jgi:hypothetical protein
MPIIPATREADKGGLRFETSLSKVYRRPWWKINLKKKQDLKAWLLERLHLHVKWVFLDCTKPSEKLPADKQLSNQLFLVFLKGGNFPKVSRKLSKLLTKSNLDTWENRGIPKLCLLAYLLFVLQQAGSCDFMCPGWPWMLRLQACTTIPRWSHYFNMNMLSKKSQTKLAKFKVQCNFLFIVSKSAKRILQMYLECLIS